MPGDAFNGMALRIQQCGELDKPIFVGEVGLRPVDVGGSYDSRTASLRAKLTDPARGRRSSATSSGAGDLRRGRSNDYDIGPGDQVPELLAAGPKFETPTTPVDSDWVAPFITLTRPNRALYTLNEPLTAAFSCTESGSSGLATCVGTQPNGSTLEHGDARALHVHGQRDRQHRQPSIDLARLRRHRRRRDDDRAARPCDRLAPTRADIGASTAVPVQTSVAFTAPGGPATPVSIDMHVAEHRRAERLRDPRQRGRHRPRRRDATG